MEMNQVKCFPVVVVDVDVASNVNELAEVPPEGAVVVELPHNATPLAFVVGRFVDDLNENIFLLKYSTWNLIGILKKLRRKEPFDVNCLTSP